MRSLDILLEDWRDFKAMILLYAGKALEDDAEDFELQLLSGLNDIVSEATLK